MENSLPHTLLAFCFVLMAFSGFAQDLTHLTIHELDSLGIDAYNKNDYQKCIFFLQKSAEKAQELGVDSIYARSLNYLGYIYEHIDNHKEAERYYLESKKIRAKALGTNHPDYAVTLNNLAVLYRHMEQYKKAEKLLQEALEINKKASGVNTTEYGMNLTNLANLYETMGKYEEAILFNKQAMEIYRSTIGEIHDFYITTLVNLGSVYIKMGRYEDAEELLLQAKNTWKKALSSEHPKYATILMKLASVYHSMERYEQAELLKLQAKEIRKNVFGENNPQYATTLHDLAVFYWKTKRLKEGEELVIKALEIYKKTLGPTHSEYANALNSLSAIYQGMYLYEKALLLQKEALLIIEKTKGKNNEQYLVYLNSLANIYRLLKRFVESENIYLQIYALSEKTFGKEHHLTLVLLNNLGKLYQEIGALDKAKNCFKKTCFDNIKTNIPDSSSLFKDIALVVHSEFYENSDILASLDYLATTLKLEYDSLKKEDLLVQSYQCLQAAIKITENIRNSFSSDQDKLTILNLTNHLVETAIAIGSKLAKTNKKYLADLFVYAEQNKSVLLTDATKAQRARAISDLPDSLALKELELQQNLQKLKKQKIEAKGTKKITEITAKLNELNINIATFKKKIEQEYPQYYQLKYASTTADVEIVQKKLDHKTALLEYLVTDSTLYLFCITKKDIYFYELPIHKKVLTEQIAILRKTLSNYEFIVGTEKNAFQLYVDNAYWFFEKLLSAAIAPLNKEIESLVIVADGELGHLPFEVFLTEKHNNQKIEYSNLSYLIQRFDISYNYSATLLTNNAENKSLKKSNNGQILACAASYPTTNKEFLGVQKSRNGLNNLPSAKDEIETLSSFLEGTFLVDSSANEFDFKNKASDFAIIHLAMHGLLDKNNPILSSLVFTENGDSIEDNFLQAYEIAHLNLNAELAVLSACETGYGRFQQGEGIISLARSFMYAGVPSLVVSLWQVNDHSTSVIMKLFYSYLIEGMNPSAALRLAKLEYLKHATGIAAHPAYWSAFIQLGENAPLSLQKTNLYLKWAFGMIAFLFVVGGVVGGILYWKKNKRQ